MKVNVSLKTNNFTDRCAPVFHFLIPVVGNRQIFIEAVV